MAHKVTPVTHLTIIADHLALLPYTFIKTAALLLTHAWCECGFCCFIDRHAIGYVQPNISNNGNDIQLLERGLHWTSSSHVSIGISSYQTYLMLHFASNKNIMMGSIFSFRQREY